MPIPWFENIMLPSMNGCMYTPLTAPYLTEKYFVIEPLFQGVYTALDAINIVQFL